MADDLEVSPDQGVLDLPDESRRIETDDGKFAFRPVESTPIDNQADRAWTELTELREEARDLGIEVSDSWPVNRLQKEIAKVRPIA